MNFNKHFQEVRAFEGKMCYKYIFGALIGILNFFFFFFLEVALNQETLDNQTQYHPQQIFCDLKLLYERYEQVHTRGLLGLHLSSVQIPHDL